jgi:murein DD-endopeptidase MepM/ murein hydrolase activator NlpD
MIKRFTIYVSGIMLLLSACSGPGLFGSRSAHRQYAEKLKTSGLADYALGKKWLEAAEKCVYDSLAADLPYRESGYFAANIPQSACVRLKPQRGQKITIAIETRPASGVKVFAELWSAGNNRQAPELLAMADSTLQIVYEQDKDQDLVLRIQPELLVSVSYTLNVFASPSLAFPVPGNDGKKVGSFWGDVRGGGKRSHEGIDIFDKFRTPVIAACDGMVTRVNENGLGGKCVWLNAAGKHYSLYYAHLDSQIARPFQQVKTGDTLGLMGNTGNAKYTPTHLHFGIYANGAVNPLPFVQQVSTTPEPVKGNKDLLTTQVRISSRQATLLQSPGKKAPVISSLPLHTLVQVDAASGNYYKVTLPDGLAGFVAIQSVAELTVPVKTYTVSGETMLLADAGTDRPVKQPLPAETTVAGYALFNDYLYVKYRDTFGWVHTNDTRPAR